MLVLDYASGSLILMSRLATTHAAHINGTKYRAMTWASLCQYADSQQLVDLLLAILKQPEIRKSGSYQIVETLILTGEPVQMRRLVRNYTVRIYLYVGVFTFLDHITRLLVFSITNDNCRRVPLFR